MGDKTGISWTNSTWNAIRGCTPVSPGCKNCYAAKVAKRFSGPGGSFEGLVRINAAGQRTDEWNGEITYVEDHLLDPIMWKRPRRIFVNSVSDLFHHNVSDTVIDRIFAVMALAPQHTFQVLTKRPERMRDYVTSRSHHPEEVGLYEAIVDLSVPKKVELDFKWFQWPLPNVWLGTSVENQKYADERIPLLLQTPAAVRFISAEPLLGPIDLAGWVKKSKDWKWFPIECKHGYDACPVCDGEPKNPLDWVIVGGESQRGSRPMDPRWAKSLRDQCKAAGVPFFFKQWGDWTPNKPESYCRVSGQRYSHETYSWADDGVPYNALNPPIDHFPSVMVYRVGAKKTGDLLDGVQYHEYPEVRA